MRVAELVLEAHALTVFRGLPSGEGRAYTATWFPKAPWQGCERFVRTASFVGWVTDWPEDAAEREAVYGVLDVLDAEGDIVQDYAIPTAAAFQQIKRKLNLGVDHEPIALTEQEDR